MATQFCFKTIVDHRAEVWGITLMQFDSALVTGSSDTNLRVYSITENNDQTGTYQPTHDSIDYFDDNLSPIHCNYIGMIQRIGKGRTMNLFSDPTGTIIGCNGTNNMVELFYFCNEAEVQARFAKRLKKSSKALSTDTDDKSREISLVDKIKRLPSIKVNDKIKSFDMLISNGKEIKLVVSLANNSLSLFSLELHAKHADAKLLRSIQKHGHHNEIRALAFSSDNVTIATGSGDQIKLWSKGSQNCLKTVDVDYTLTITFVPGDRHLLVGQKSGNLLILDTLTGDITESIQAHEKELWSICILPDKSGCVTGGGDQTVKFWSFELIENPNEPNKKLLSLLHKSTLSMNESILSIQLSNNSKFVAVALLDNTVKIFFCDTFKLYLTLYGHNLPVLCMDISFDSTLIATGSADKKVKIWGLDFGDCHRSLLAHEDSVMALQFIPKTHMFFTCGKDGKIKQWDADNFQKIITLPGHIGEAYNLTVSLNGKFVVTAGNDRTLRLFERTNEPLVLQDVQEEERSEIENKQLATGDDSNIPALPALKLPSRKTVGAEKGAETILECLEVSSKFEAQDSKNDVPALMIAYESKTSFDFLVNVLSRIRASDLEESLILLPFSSICDILKKMPHLLNTRKDQTELLCKVLVFIFKIHQKSIMNHQALLNTIRDIQESLETALNEIRNLFGYNLFALEILKSSLQSSEEIELFKDASKTHRVKQKKQKEKQLRKRLFIQMQS